MKKTWFNFVRRSNRDFARGFVVLRAAKRGDDVAREWWLGTGNTVQ